MPASDTYPDPVEEGETGRKGKCRILACLKCMSSARRSHSDGTSVAPEPAEPKASEIEPHEEARQEGNVKP